MKQSLKPSQRKRVVALSVILVCGAIITGFIARAASNSNDQYCQSIDPTSCNVKVEILNDTHDKLTVRQCGDDFSISCKKHSSDLEGSLLAPSESIRTNGSREKDAPQPWIITSQAGQVKGCLNLQFTKDTPSPITVKLSEAISCKDFL